MKEQQIKDWKNAMDKETDKTYKKQINKESDAIVEYLKWRAEDANNSIPLMITWFCVFIAFVMLCVLCLYVWGVFPHGETTTVCTTTKIVSGLIA